MKRKKRDAKKTMVRAVCIMLCVLLVGGSVVTVIISLL